MPISWIGRQFKPHVCMKLIVNSVVIKRYYEKLSKRGFIIDHKVKLCWKIPADKDLIKDSGELFFFGSKEILEPMKYEECDKNAGFDVNILIPSERNKFIKKELSIPFLRANLTENNWQLEKSKFILRQEEKIPFRAKTYHPVLNSIDLPSLYEVLTGEAMNQVMRAPNIKKHINWGDILLIIVVIGMCIGGALYYLWLKSPHPIVSLFFPLIRGTI